MRTLTHIQRAAVICGSALALLLLCAPHARAQNTARQQPPPSEETPAAAADAASLLSQLNLTAAQVSQMREIREQSVPQARELRSEEHTSELQSRQYLVCRLLLEKKKKHIYISTSQSSF